MYKGVKYKEKILESGLTIPTEILTSVVLRIESTPDASLGLSSKVKQVAWVEITPENPCYLTLVTEFENGFVLTDSFGKRVLENQGMPITGYPLIHVLIS